MVRRDGGCAMKRQRIDALALDSYQRAARVMLANHLVTRVYPDRIALPLIRRWATELREDLAELFGYRLEVTETTARLYPVHDRLDDARPARSVNDRVFDRRRYAYLSLALAALGRAGDQITLSELAEHVADYASRIEGLDLSTERAADRDAFVDAVGWLGARGALTLADGDAGAGPATRRRARRSTTSTDRWCSPCSGRREHSNTCTACAVCWPMTPTRHRPIRPAGFAGHWSSARSSISTNCRTPSGRCWARTGWSARSNTAPACGPNAGPRVWR